MLNKLGLSADIPPPNPWTAMVQDILQAWVGETADEPTPANAFIEYASETS